MFKPCIDCRDKEKAMLHRIETKAALSDERLWFL